MSGAYRPIRNVRKRLHNNLQIFWGEDPQTPHFPPLPQLFLQKRLHIKSLYSGIHIKNRILGGSYGVTDSLFTWKVLTILT